MNFLRKKVIGAESPNGPLLVRYILFRCAAFGIFLHHMLRSDHDRALHDHPWPFVSIVLSGGYYEFHDQTLTRKATVLWHGRGSVLVRPAEWRHQFQLTRGLDRNRTVIDVVDRQAWTLVIVGRRCRRWGFFVPKEPDSLGNRRFTWCWWRKYNSSLAICSEEILYMDGED